MSGSSTEAIPLALYSTLNSREAIPLLLGMMVVADLCPYLPLRCAWSTWARSYDTNIETGSVRDKG